MNKTMKCSMKIAAIIAAVGLILAASGFIAGGMQPVSIESSGITLTSDTNDNRSVDQTYSDITSMDVDIDMRDVILKEGAEFRVQSKGVGNNFEVENNGGKLVIKDSVKRGFSFNIFEFDSDSSSHADLIITYPAGVTFDDIRISSDWGGIDIEKTNADYVELNADLGTAKINNSTIKKIDAKLDSGTMTLKDTEVESLKYNMDLGNLNASNFTGHTINGVQGSGSTHIQGTVTGAVDITGDLGDITLDISGDEKQHSLDLKTDLGEISVNGTNSSNSLTRINEGKPLINIRADMGNISIKFKLAHS